MNKRYLSLSMLTLLSVVMTGCSEKNEEAGRERYSDNAQPIGYYSNENHQGGNARLLDDNDGPLTEMMDHTAGEEGRNINQKRAKMLQVKDENGNPANPTDTITDHPLRSNRHLGGSDLNYHGQLNTQANMSDKPTYDSSLSKKVARESSRVRNVKDAKAAVFGNKVLIAVDLNGGSDRADIKAAIEDQVVPFINGRSLTITTDKKTLSRLKKMENDMKNGRTGAQLTSDLRDLFLSIDHPKSK